MILYSRNDASQIWDADGVEYTPDPKNDNAFDVPTEFADKLLGQHVAGEKVWETYPERSERLLAEEVRKRRDDPEYLVRAILAEKTAPTAAELRAQAKALLAEADELEPKPARKAPVKK